MSSKMSKKYKFRLVTCTAVAGTRLKFASVLYYLPLPSVYALSCTQGACSSASGFRFVS